ncbi:MAG: sulfite exporter TauE/SafE family protein [Beijerinckiaceae bacterium]
MEIYLPIAELPVNILLILGMGAAVGFVSGMFGVGGGFLMTPFLIFTGIPPAIAVASVSAQLAGSSMTSVLSYMRKRAVDFRLGGVLVFGGAIGTVCGVLFFNQMRKLGQLELIIVVSYVVLFSAIGGLMFIESLKAFFLARKKNPLPVRRKRRKRPAYFSWPVRIWFRESRIVASAIPFALLAFVIAFIGAVLGIGGGFILVPALIYLFHVPAAVVVGTSLFQILITMTLATVMHAMTSHSVDIILAVLLIVGGVIGAQFGARAGQNMRGEVFRLLLAVMILGVGLRFASDIVIRPNEPFSLRVENRPR